MISIRPRTLFLLSSLALIPIGIYIQSSLPFQRLKSRLISMASESLQETFVKRADELREYIFSQPASNFENKPWALADAIETFSNEKGHMMIFRDAKLAVAKEALQAQTPAPRTILEFGTFVGKSALAWGAMLRDIHGENLPEDVNVYTFDPNPKMVALTRDFVKLAGLENIVHVVEGPGGESVRKLVEEGKVTSVDMAFYDHWEKFYLPDLQLMEELKLWRVGSLAIADNTDMPGAPDYLAYVKAGGSGVDGAVKYDSKTFETHGGRGPVSTSTFSFDLGSRNLNLTSLQSVVEISTVLTTN